MNNAFSAYKKQSVTTLTPGDVVVKLYMEAERQLNRVSKNLDSLYEYFNREIVEANIKKDKAKVDALLPMIGELREAFAEINSMSREQMEAQEKAAQSAMQEQA